MWVRWDPPHPRRSTAHRHDCGAGLLPSKGRARIRGGELPVHRLGKIRASRGGGATWRDPGVGTDLVSRNSGCHRNRSHVIGARRASDKEWSSDSEPTAAANLARPSPADHLAHLPTRRLIYPTSAIKLYVCQTCPRLCGFRGARQMRAPMVFKSSHTAMLVSGSLRVRGGWLRPRHL